MHTRLIDYKSPEFETMTRMRNKILREPLGIVFSDEDLKKEENDLFCIYEDNQQIVGCCILTRIDDDCAQLRQMAIEPKYQGKGIGATILHYGETVAKQNGYKSIMLHARQTATGFYRKYGYHAVGDIFMEMAIPHIEMKKTLT